MQLTQEGFKTLCLAQRHGIARNHIKDGGKIAARSHNEQSLASCQIRPRWDEEIPTLEQRTREEPTRIQQPSWVQPVQVQGSRHNNDTSATIHNMRNSKFRESMHKVNHTSPIYKDHTEQVNNKSPISLLGTVYTVSLRKETISKNDPKTKILKTPAVKSFQECSSYPCV